MPVAYISVLPWHSFILFLRKKLFGDQHVGLTRRVAINIITRRAFLTFYVYIIFRVSKTHLLSSGQSSQVRSIFYWRFHTSNTYYPPGNKRPRNQYQSTC